MNLHGLVSVESVQAVEEEEVAEDVKMDEAAATTAAGAYRLPLLLLPLLLRQVRAVVLEGDCCCCRYCRGRCVRVCCTFGTLPYTLMGRVIVARLLPLPPLLLLLLLRQVCGDHTIARGAVFTNRLPDLLFKQPSRVRHSWAPLFCDVCIWSQAQRQRRMLPHRLQTGRRAVGLHLWRQMLRLAPSQMHQLVGRVSFPIQALTRVCPVLSHG